MSKKVVKMEQVKKMQEEGRATKEEQKDKGGTRGCCCLMAQSLFASRLLGFIMLSAEYLLFSPLWSVYQGVLRLVFCRLPAYV
jgi:hypothetical protein